MKKDLEKTKAEFKQFMDMYVALMKLQHQKDMEMVWWELGKLLGLVGLALLYQFYIMPILETIILRK